MGYRSPDFFDEGRLERLKKVFPEIDAIYEAHAKMNHFPGHTYGIVLDGKLVHSRYSGYSDLKTKALVTKHSMFRIASMTKSFVAMAILKLQGEGKLSLNDPVSMYIPEMPENTLVQDARTITIKDLLIHSSGLPFDDPWADRKLDMPESEFKEFLQNGLSFSNPVGIAYEYSSLNYALLGNVISNVSGIPYETYITENIWKKIGMEEAAWNIADVRALNVVRGYRKDLKEEALLSPGTFGAIGGVICSLESFSKYMALNLLAYPPRDEKETGPIKRSSIREMHEPLKFINFIPYKYLEERISAQVSFYGLGLRWIRDLQGRVFVGHSGGLPGFGGNWFIMPDYGLGVISLANTTYAATTEINLKVLEKIVVTAGLNPRKLLPSKALKKAQNTILELLPDLENIHKNPYFSENFLLDHSIDTLKKEVSELFTKAGKILSFDKVIPQTELNGYFIVNCEKENLKVKFSLTPEKQPLIQEMAITYDTNAKI